MVKQEPFSLLHLKVDFPLTSIKSRGAPAAPPLLGPSTPYVRDPTCTAQGAGRGDRPAAGHRRDMPHTLHSQSAPTTARAGPLFAKRWRWRTAAVRPVGRAVAGAARATTHA